MPPFVRGCPPAATLAQTDIFIPLGCPNRPGGSQRLVVWIDNIDNVTNTDKATIDVLAIDPGETTGYAFGQINVEEGLMKVSTGQERWTPGNLMLVLQTMLPDIIIYEDFAYRNRARSGLVLYSVQLIGVINLYGEMHPECRLVKQSPGIAIGQFYDNAKLKEVALYKSTPGGHANDACRHLLQWFRFRGGGKYNKKGVQPG